MTLKSILELSVQETFQPKTGWLALLSEDGWIILWQAALEAAQVLEGAEAEFSCLAWHPTG